LIRISWENVYDSNGIKLGYFKTQEAA